MSTKTAPSQIREFAKAKSAGEPFAVRELVRFGPRAAVDQALSRMVKSGELERPTRGVYVRPLVNKTLGRSVPASTEKVIGAVAAASNAKVQPHGSEAARKLGLSTQAPMRSVYATTGRSGTVRIGSREVQLRHVAPRFMALAGTPAGEVLSALRYLGKSEVSQQTIEQVARVVGPEVIQELREHVEVLPSWLSDLLIEKRTAA